MSTTVDLIAQLKAELKAAGVTYAVVAERLGMAESSVKRMFSKEGDMPVSRIDDICRIINLDFADLARRVADSAAADAGADAGAGKGRGGRPHAAGGGDLRHEPGAGRGNPRHL
jgi:transcriptional regulator with XRE-family HTH domain